MKSVTTGLALLLSVPVSAQQPTSKQAWREFSQTQRPGWTVQWNPATGTPAKIYGPGLNLGLGRINSLAAAKLASTALLNQHQGLLGRGGSTFEENIGLKVNQLYVFVYSQSFQGLPVISGRADVRIHETGVASMFGAAAVAIPEGFVTKPALSVARAQATATKHVFGEGQEPAAKAATQLVIWADTTSSLPTRATLAFEVEIDARPKAMTVGKVYVDAATGAVLQFKNEVYSCRCGEKHAASGSSRHASRLNRAARLRELAAPTFTLSSVTAPKMALTGRVMGWTNVGIFPDSPLTNIPMPRIRVTSSVGSAFTDGNGDFSIPYNGTTPVTVSVQIEGEHSKLVTAQQGTPLTASAAVTPGTPATLQLGTQSMGQFDFSQTTTYWHVDFINEWMRGLLPGSTTELDTISGIQPIVNIPSSCNAFYTNLTISHFAASSQCAMTAYQTVVAHEWGHGIDDVFGGISQVDGLSEGWGDILAIYQSRQPEVGPGFFLGQTNGIRSGLNTNTYPSGFGPHAQGETWMGFAWDLRENLISTLGSAAGEARAHQIVVASVAADAKNQPDAVLEVFLLDDDDGDLTNGTPNYVDLRDACLKRTLPFPRRNPSQLAAFGTGCPSGPQGDQICTNVNWSAALANQTTTATRMGVFFPTTTNNLGGVTLFTQARTAPTTVNVTLHEFDTTTIQPGTTVLASGQVTVGTTAGAYRALFTQPYRIPNPKTLVFVFDNADQLILPLATGGTRHLYWTFAAQWSQPLFGSTKYQLICDNGFQSPVQTSNTDPIVGTTFETTLSNAPANRAGVLAIGFSDTNWNGTALPWTYGAPCELLVSLDALRFRTTDANGEASTSFAIPNQRSLAGIEFFTQYLISEPVNAFGVIGSNGLRGKIGEN